MSVHSSEVRGNSYDSHRDGTLIGLLRERARLQPADRPFTFLQDGEEETGSLTYAELDRRARALAVELARRGLAGERALLLYPSGLDLIVAFFGCLYAGTVAVPAYPPRQNRNLQRLRTLVASARPRAVLTDRAVLSRSRAGVDAGDELRALPWLATDELDTAGADDWTPPDVAGDGVAFLQFTSGSTSAPKGVVLTHAHLLANQEMIAAAFAQTAASVIVGWLPLHHDMGLIGNVLQPLWLGARCVLMPPTAFLQRPLRWLQAISRYRATTSGGPDFAYDLCARRIAPADRAGLDLASWSVAFSGAEPVRAETLDRFTAAFAPQGFRRAAFYPCYGLAEATLFVAGGAAGRPPEVRTFSASNLERGWAVLAAPVAARVRSLVSCGGPWGGEELAIVDAATRTVLGERQVGEIWVRGAGVAAGYFADAAATAETFGAALAGGEGPFLRTGDLGFLDGGELFIAGRLKDLLIVRGRNVYPQDVEAAAAASHPALRAGGGAAFAFELAGEERLVVVQEIERGRAGEAAGALAAIARAVAEEVEAQPHEIVLLRAGSLLKTSSGKVQRGACREAYRNGELAVVARSGAAAEAAGEGAPGRRAVAALSPGERQAAIAAWLGRQAAAVAGIAPASAAAALDSLAAAGLDSLGAVELASRMEAAFGLAPPLELLLRGATVGELSAHLAARLPEFPAAAAMAEAAGPAAGGLPLHPGQRGLWFLQTASPASGAYQIAGAGWVLSELDPAALARALHGLVERHPALRTSFALADGEPRRQEAARGEAEVADIAVEDATGWGEERMLDHLAAAAWRPFDLARGALLRAVILPRADGPAAFLLVVHHLAADLWSMAILLRDLGGLYARETGSAAALPAAVAEPPGWAAARERALAGAEGERLWAYWQERLAGAPPAVELPADRPRSRPPREAGEVRRRGLDVGLAGSLRSLGRERGATLFSVLLAGFAALLARYGRQDDFVIGASTAGRGGGATGEVVGCFVEALPLRADLSGAPGFAALVERLHAGTVGALVHAGLGPSRLAERLGGERAAGRMALFDALFAFQQAPSFAAPDLAPFALGHPAARLVTGGLVLAPAELGGRPVQLDLMLLAAESAGGLALAFEYRQERFDAATVDRLLAVFATLLRAAVAAPEIPFAELPLLAAEERLQLLRSYTAGPGGEAPGAGRCLHEGFFRQAGRTPDAVALIDGTESLTYGELRDRVIRLAGRLRELGVGPEDRVGVCLERSPALVAALLGVLAAGGAYVPLPPDYPAERLEVLARDAGLKLLVTRARWRGRAPESAPWLDLDAPDADAGRPASELPPGGPCPENLAYLIYTSGSTGAPKGVAIEHRSAALLVAWASRAFTPAELAGVLAATVVSFDVSVFELFAPLSLGGTVILAADALRLPELAARSRVTMVSMVPSVAAELVASPGWPDSVRTVNLGGEAVTGALARRVLDRPGVRRLLNLYGPSEDTTYSTVAELTRDGEREPAIGRPLPGKTAYVVDGDGQPLPPGVPGELLLGGGGVARGYLGRPDLTAERFLPDPFAATPGARLYRTGDLARRRPDGELECLGRLDHQVKLRGYRVEPGEIEAALAAQPGVREAAVVLRSDDRLGGRLVAYVAGPPADAAPALRAALARRLPAPLVPAAYVVLPALPRTPHGKVDRRALPAPPPAAAGDGHEAAGGAESPEEAVLAALFARLLGVDRVAAGDGFFTLGGHSLLAMRLLSEVREALGVELAVADVFDAPTPAELARRVVAARAAAEGEPIARRAEGEEAPLSFGQRRLWLFDRLRPGLAVYHVPGVLYLRGALDERALAAAAAGVVTRHETLRTSFVEAAGEPRQRVSPPAAAPLPVIDLTALGPRAAAEADRVAAGEARRPFDLGQGPLQRLRLLRVQAGESRLLAVLHHAVCDGASLALLLAEIAAGYRDAAGGRPPPALAPLRVQYGDFALWQHRRLSGEAYEGAVAAWRKRLEGAPPALDLPADRPRPAVSAFRGTQVASPLPAGLGEGAARLARESAATLFMTLAAGTFALLGRLTGEEDIVLGTPVLGRSRPELAESIGFFVNTLPLRCDLAGDPPFRELLARVRRSALDAYRRQEVPFERLVEELRPVRDLARSPILQVMLLLEQPLPAPELPGLETAVEELATGTAKFDLTLAVRQQGDRLAAACELDSELFDAVTGERLLERFGRLLQAAAAAPERRLSELPLLAASERQQLLAEAWGRPAPPLAWDGLEESVLAQAARTPGATAVIGAGERWTYGELAARIEAVAARLRALGAGAETIVGVCLERSPDLVAALLGVLRTGAAYLPLDPVYPPERLAWMLEDAAAPLVLTSEALAGRLPEGSARRVTLRELAALPPLPAVGPAAGARRLAYLIYTSGSTGRPKAVAIEHRSALARLAWAREAFAPAELAGVLAATSVCFDMSVFELFAPLSLGGTVVLADNLLSLGGLQASSITLVNTVPSVLAELLDARELPPGVRAVNLGGEPLPRELASRLLAAVPPPRVRNLYGPSEDTTYSTCAVIAPGGGAPPIGFPLPGTEALVLDRHMSLAPPGAPGELYLGGDGLARGYFDRPDLTAERFLPNPFGGPGERLYRTGDLVRRAAGGELKHIGRIDHQVKVRGFRIEPGEIEAALEAHPAVRQAVVSARDEGGGGRRLVAFVVPVAEPPAAAELRAFLKQGLPEHLLPSEVVSMSTFPVTATGKVDRKALAVLAAARRSSPAAVAPRTPLEATIAAAFADLLGYERIGVHDDFFDLGGHSLLAYRLQGRLSSVFAVEVPLRSIFESPTVAGMALAVARALLAEAGGEAAAAVLAEMESR